jgi:hypothetical protein
VGWVPAGFGHRAIPDHMVIGTAPPAGIRMILGLQDTDPSLFVRILPSASKKCKKNLDFYCFGSSKQMGN